MSYVFKNDKLQVSHSSMELFDSCARKFEFTKMYSAPRGFGSLAADAGKALHEAYQKFLITRDEDEALFTLLQHYPTEMEETINNPRSIEACYASLMALMYSTAIDEYEIAHINIPGKGDTPCVEVPFEINILQNGEPFYLDKAGKRIPISYIGYMDLILWNRADRRHVVFDVKSTRQHIDFAARYAFDEQALPYSLVLQHTLGQQIDVLDVHYLIAYVDLEKPTVQDLPYDKNMNDVQDWARKLLMRLEQLRYMYEFSWFPRSAGACSSYGTVCNYFDICAHRDQNIVARFIKSLKDANEKSHREDMQPWITVDLELGG